ncbi:MAG: nitrophenyl compound nitroreductase subunit ArsF family protein [Victivallaceae bacterium]|nr:nitrophenyl compound nitroreductase subunit ArsF family protein [Victivallaceae bacterium]
MKVQVLGSGCDKCKKLAANAEEAAAKLGLTCEIEKVTDINEITAHGVMMTPALVIDGKVVGVGKVLSPDEIAKFLTAPACACGGTGEASPKESADCGDGAPAQPPISCCGSGETTSCCGGGCGGKKVLTIILLSFVAASIVFMVFKEVKAKNAAAASPATGTEQTVAVPRNENVLTVYYFHGTQRCMTCNRIEELARAAIQDKYAKEMAAGAVVFRSVNVEEPANEHFIRDFQLTTRSVVMQKAGKYEKFDAVWTLVRDPRKFAEYIQDGAAKMMEVK